MKLAPLFHRSLLIGLVCITSGSSSTGNISHPETAGGVRNLAPRPLYILGADLSSVPERLDQGAVFVDVDGIEKDLLDLLKNHGFNSIRLRTFVDPLARFGYASDEGEWCSGKAEAYNDKEHVVAYAKQVKAAGMSLLLDIHYSDTWADPQKQVIPQAWRAASTVEELAGKVKAYTNDLVQALADADARPDMVQVGNEITPGFLIHVPTAETDCFGNNSAVNPGVNGSTADWDAFATLLGAGIDAVREVDPGIRIMLHIENLEDPDGIVAWVENVRQREIRFDILGLSAYQKWQGPSRKWRGTMRMLATRFPDLCFLIVEYNPKPELVNETMLELPDNRGLGTYFWEPLQSGAWGQSIFRQRGNTYTAKKADFAIFDRLSDRVFHSNTDHGE
jgi:arabinogalactan endo-1,4-beta-galactosidase